MSRPTVETQIVFENEGQKLYGFLVLPAGAGPHPAVALLDGMGGSSHGPRRMFAQLARQLGARGLAALRFSYRGHGDSEGDHGDVTIERELDDARAALAFLARQPGVDGARLGVVGMSLGGLVAAGAAGTHPEVRALVLWSAVAHNGDRVAAWMAPEKRADLRRHGYYDDGGWAINAAYDEQLRGMDGAAMVVSYRGPSLILHGTTDRAVPIADAYRYKNALGERAELVEIDGADHTYARLPWEGAVLGRTVDFLQQHLLREGRTTD